MKEQYRLYMLEQLKKLKAIDSIAGFTHEVEAYLHEEIVRLGFEPKHTVKGGVLADLGGKGNGVCVMAHADLPNPYHPLPTFLMHSRLVLW